MVNFKYILSSIKVNGIWLNTSICLLEQVIICDAHFGSSSCNLCRLFGCDLACFSGEEIPGTNGGWISSKRKLWKTCHVDALMLNYTPEVD